MEFQKTASAIYNASKDFDFLDHTETEGKEIDLLASAIDKLKNSDSQDFQALCNALELIFD